MYIYIYINSIYIYTLSFPSAQLVFIGQCSGLNVQVFFFSAKVLDLFDEALEPSLRVAFDGTDSTPCLDARRFAKNVGFEHIYDSKEVHGII